MRLQTIFGYAVFTKTSQEKTRNNLHSSVPAASRLLAVSAPVMMPERAAACNTLGRAFCRKSQPHITSHELPPPTGHAGAALAVAVAVAVKDGNALGVGVAALTRVAVCVPATKCATMLGAKTRPAVGWVEVCVAVTVGVAVGRVGVTVGVGVQVNTRTMICAVGPTFPPASISCAVSSESPVEKACGRFISSQNCAVADEFTYE